MRGRTSSCTYQPVPHSPSDCPPPHVAEKRRRPIWNYSVSPVPAPGTDSPSRTAEPPQAAGTQGQPNQSQICLKSCSSRFRIYGYGYISLLHGWKEFAPVFPQCSQAHIHTHKAVCSTGVHRSLMNVFHFTLFIAGLNCPTQSQSQWSWCTWKVFHSCNCLIMMQRVILGMSNYWRIPILLVSIRICNRTILKRLQEAVDNRLWDQ